MDKARAETPKARRAAMKRSRPGSRSRGLVERTRQEGEIEACARQQREELRLDQ
jgi:hypothetical protein